MPLVGLDSALRDARHDGLGRVALAIADNHGLGVVNFP